MKKLLTLVLVVMISLTLIACSTNTTSPTTKETSSTSTASSKATTAKETAKLNPYRVALYAPLTGDNAQYGLTFKKTIELYLEQLNSKGGIKGHPVELVTYDDKNDPKESLNIANLIVSDKTILAAIGSQTSTATLQAAPVFQKAGIPMLTPTGSHVDITKIGEYIFRIGPLSSYEGEFIGKWMINDKHKKVAIIYANDDYGLTINSVWKKTIEDAGSEVVCAETFVSGQTKDFSPLITKIKESGATAIYIEPSYADAAMIINQMAQLECKAEKYGSSMLYKNEFLALVGNNGNGLHLDSFVNPDNKEENYVSISTAYEKSTGKITDNYVLNSYDAIMVLCQAWDAVGTNGKDVVKWIADLKNWQGAGGLTTWDENRNPSKELFHCTIVNGKYTF